MSAPLVIVIPTKDRRDLLERALNGARAQLPEDGSIIIVDDGSSDGTAAFLESLGDPKVTVIRHASSRGVNISRNEALRRAPQGAWAVLLDDDDELLPGALSTIAARLDEVPERIGVAFFNTRITTPRETFTGGYQFPEGDPEVWHDPTYLAVMMKEGLRGDCKPVVRASLFATGRYSFSDDVNGFESEFYALLARDGIGLRYFRDIVMRVDQAHGQERLSDTAAIRDPRSFVRVHLRVLRAHEKLLAEHPELLRRRAQEGFKISLRAGALSAALAFALALARSYRPGSRER